MKQERRFLIGSAVLLCTLVLACILFAFGSFKEAVHRIKGEAFYVYPRTVRLGDRAPATTETVVFHLKNLTDDEISVVGEKTSCSCVVTEDLPIVVKPHETVDVKVRSKTPKQRSEYDQTVLFMVATPSKLAMCPVRIMATVSTSLPDQETTERTESDTESKESSDKLLEVPE